MIIRYFSTYIRISSYKKNQYRNFFPKRKYAISSIIHAKCF